MTKYLDRLKGKRVLIVDDEPDMLESLEEMLDICRLETASTFEEGRTLLESRRFDAAILDIMGVQGYQLLNIAVEKKIPAIMLTAHALSSENFVISMKAGATIYIPKDEILNLAFFVAEAISPEQPVKSGPPRWFEKLKPYFDWKFGSDWLERYKDFWEEKL
ncbi:MAG: response regulator [Thermodesulfobacteriota bacterium]